MSLGTILPFEPSNPRYRFGTDIGVYQVSFDVHYNSRDAAWMFDIVDLQEKPIICGVRVVLGVLLCRASTHPMFADNVIYATDLSRQDREATFDDLGTRVLVIHRTLQEILTP